MRFFNTAGPCDPGRHYMLPPERRLPELRGLIDRQLYFVIHAPRQSGKTTLVQSLAKSLTASGSYTALLASCETDQAVSGDVEAGIAAVLDAIRLAAVNDLPDELKPPPAESSVPATTRLQDLLSRWCRQSPRPVVLFLDEIDALSAAFRISVLRQLSAGYGSRPQSYPQTVVFVGVRDVHDFNIKLDSLTLPNFNADEVTELYDQHTRDTGQIFTSAAKALAFELTQGQPWLVNALGSWTVEKLVPDPSLPVEAAHIKRAKEILTVRRDVHLSSIVDCVRDPQVNCVLEPILAGELPPPDLPADDFQFVKELGLIVPGPAGLEIANPIYREMILQR